MSSNSIRAVFDTNILVSAFNWRGGNPEKLYRAARAGQFTLLSSPAIIAETARILRNKFFWNEEALLKQIKEVARTAEIVEPSLRLSVVCDEPDNRIIECAVEGNAQLIVSGDRHLLEMKEYNGIPIIRAVDLLHILGK